MWSILLTALGRAGFEKLERRLRREHIRTIDSVCWTQAAFYLLPTNMPDCHDLLSFAIQIQIILECCCNIMFHLPNVSIYLAV